MPMAEKCRKSSILKANLEAPHDPSQGSAQKPSGETGSSDLNTRGGSTSQGTVVWLPLDANVCGERNRMIFADCFIILYPYIHNVLYVIYNLLKHAF